MVLSLSPSSSVSTPQKLPRSISEKTTSDSPSKRYKCASPASSGSKSPNNSLSPEKEKATIFPIHSSWNQFIPLNMCSMPFELPVNKYQLLAKSIEQMEQPVSDIVQADVLEKIIILAHILQPNSYVHYKRNTSIIHPVGEVAEQVLARSFLVVATKDKIYGCVSAHIILGQGSIGKVIQAIGYVFCKKNNEVILERKFDAAKHTIRVGDLNGRTDDGVVRRAKSRIQAAVDLNGVSNVVNPYFHGLLKGKNGLKLIMLYDRYNGDLLKFQKMNLKPEKRLDNALIVAHQISKALSRIHSKGYLHRDIKDANLLANWSKDHLLTKVDVGDFDLCTTKNPNDSRITQICGTREFAAPEMLARVFHFKRFFEALGVEDPIVLMGPGLDTFPFGVVLHAMYYGTYPKITQLMMDYNIYLELLDESQDEERRKSYREDLVNIKNQWEELILKMLNEQKDRKNPEVLTVASFIESLIFIDPRMRPNDSQIISSLGRIKS